MNRRSFLAAVASATAAMTVAGESGAIAASVASKKPCTAQEMLLALLKECEPIGMEQICTLDGPTFYRVKYRRGIKEGIGDSTFGMPYGVPISDIDKVGMPTSFTVTQFVEGGELRLGERPTMNALKPQMELVVDWVVAA